MNVIKVSVYLQVHKFSLISLPIFTLFIEDKTLVGNTNAHKKEMALEGMKEMT